MPAALRRLPIAASFLLLLLPLLGGRCSPIDAVFGVLQLDGTLPVEIRLQSGQDPATTRVTLDGVDVTARFQPAPNGLVGSVPLPPPGTSTLLVEATSPAPLLPSGYRISQTFPLTAPAAAPALAGFDPAAVSGTLPRSAWLRLRFVTALDAGSLDGPAFGLACSGVAVPRRLHRVGNSALLLDPQPDLPPGANCRVAWRGPGGGIVEQAFATATELTPAAQVLHDREDLAAVAPFPDDFYTEADATTRTGRRVKIPEPPYGGTLLQVYQGVLRPTNALDGFSRISPMVVPFSEALDPALAPDDEFEAEDPFSPIALFDIDPSSPTHGARIPFAMKLRRDSNRRGQVDHSALLFPSIALRPRGHYALVVTRRLHASGAPGRALAPSAFFLRASAPAQAGESTAVDRARASILPVLDFLASVPAVPIAREDVALVLPFSVRSDDDIPSDLLAIKEATLAAPPPPLTITSVTANADQSQTLRGTVRLPSYLDPTFQQFARNPVTGRPVATGVDDVPFVMQLPRPTAAGPAPIAMYQHGNPGSPEEILFLGNYLHNAGFAVAGMRDYINRKLGDVTAQITATFFFVLQTQAVPVFWNQTGADMLGFLRALQGLGGTAWRPTGVAQTPLLDPAQLFYHGISEGGNNALRFLPYAQELVAATPTVGGGRLVETLLHQTPTLLAQLEGFIGDVRPVQTLVGLSLFQHAYDAQDPHSYARFLYQAPFPIAGLPQGRAPSVLWTEGIGDTFVPNNATRSATRELGIPSVRRLQLASPVLTEVDAPLQANLAPDRTAGHFQYLPANTPGCFAGGEPHFCPQTAPLAQAQRLHFFQTARQGPAAEIIDPLP